MEHLQSEEPFSSDPYFSTYYTYNTTMFQTLSVSMQVMCPIFFIVIGMMQEFCELDQQVLIVDL